MNFLDGNKWLDIVKTSVAKFFFTTSIRLSVFEKLSSFVASGVPIVDTLKLLEKEYAELKDVFDVRPFAMRQWSKKMDEEGLTFSEALEGWVPASERMLIMSGEDSGDIEDAFKNCIETTTATKEMVGTIVGKLTYPIILISLLFGVIAAFSLLIVPILTSISPPERWPSVSQDLYTLSQFTTANWHWVLLSIFAIVITLSKSLGIVTGPARTLLNKVPPYSMYRSFQSSVLIMSLSSMMRSGVPIQDSLRLISNASNRYIKSEIDKILSRLDSGMQEGQAFKTGFFDDETKVDIAVYAETDNIAVHMDTIGRSAIKNGVGKVSAIASIAQILSFFAIAVYLCWAYYSFFMVVQTVGQATSSF